LYCGVWAGGAAIVQMSCCGAVRIEEATVRIEGVSSEDCVIDGVSTYK
jgi:hypothetical protein